MILAGIDLAWGDKNPDGVCLLEGHPDRVRCRFTGLTHGDDELAALFEDLPSRAGVLLAMDAPVVCPNKTGSRPIDRLMHRLFRDAHAGAYPANQNLCRRPLRVVARLEQAGFVVGSDPPWNRRQVMETFPHPCTLRWFDRDRIFKYKKGRVAEKREEFASLQRALRSHIRSRLPLLAEQVEILALLKQAWSKPVEDQTDALMCALLAYDHWFGQGRLTEVLGDPKTGAIVIPK
jgi:predicted RNase H-like nuclease